MAAKSSLSFMGLVNPPPLGMSLLFQLFTILCLSQIIGGRSESSRLQIGVKKRVDGCEIRSKKGDTLHIHYIGTLQDSGVEFDRSRRDEPFSFTVGSSQINCALSIKDSNFNEKMGQNRVIKGWEQGVLGMCVGEKRKVVVPPELGYGETGAPPDIPPNAVLAFELELVKIDQRNEL